MRRLMGQVLSALAAGVAATAFAVGCGDRFSNSATLGAAGEGAGGSSNGIAGSRADGAGGSAGTADTSGRGGGGASGSEDAGGTDAATTGTAGSAGADGGGGGAGGGMNVPCSTATCTGTCVEQRCLVTLATGQKAPFALVVDANNA